MNGNKEALLALRLQFFAADGGGAASSDTTNPDGAGAQDGGGAAADGVNGADGATEKPDEVEGAKTENDSHPPITADDVKKLIAAAFTEAEAKRTEAEKLSKMNAQEREEHLRNERETDYQNRLAELTRRELRIEAHKTLQKKGLPAELLDALQYSDAESCNASIKAVETAFRAAVESGINERLRGKPPGTSNSPAALTLDAIKAMTPEEIAANMAEVEKALEESGR